MPKTLPLNHPCTSISMNLPGQMKSSQNVRLNMGPVSFGNLLQLIICAHFKSRERERKKITYQILSTISHEITIQMKFEKVAHCTVRLKHQRIRSHDSERCSVFALYSVSGRTVIGDFFHIFILCDSVNNMLGSKCLIRI